MLFRACLLLFNITVVIYISRNNRIYSTVHDEALYDLGARQDARLNEKEVGGISVQDCFHQGEVEVQSTVALHEFDDFLHSLLNTVADNQQKKFTSLKMAGDVVDEFCFVQFRRILANQLVKNISGLPEIQRYPTLQFLVVPRSKIPCIVENLTDHLPPCLGVAPEP